MTGVGRQAQEVIERIASRSGAAKAISKTVARQSSRAAEVSIESTGAAPFSAAAKTGLSTESAQSVKASRADIATIESTWTEFSTGPAEPPSA